jgi:DNA-directed RNA polymerase specialized sigma24 family protein
MTIIFAQLSEIGRAVRITPRMRSFYPGLVISPAETALARALVTATDLLRLKAIARLHARGLPPDVGWDDLLQEAFARFIGGSRRQPEGVAIVVFLAGVMRSLKAEHWRRVVQETREPLFMPGVRELDADSRHDPERALIAWQELSTVERLFADDPLALQIVAGLAEGLSAEEIRRAHDIPKIDYESARRRMRRILLREGLTCGQA